MSGKAKEVEHEGLYYFSVSSGVWEIYVRQSPNSIAYSLYVVKDEQLRLTLESKYESLAKSQSQTP